MNINERELLAHEVQYARRGPDPGPGAMMDKDDDRYRHMESWLRWAWSKGCVWAQETT